MKLTKTETSPRQQALKPFITEIGACYELIPPPTWETAVQIHLACIQHGLRPAAINGAIAEIMRLARMMDKIIATHAAEKAARESTPLTQDQWDAFTSPETKGNNS